MAVVKMKLTQERERRAEIAAQLARGVPEPTKSVACLQQQLDSVAHLRVCLPSSADCTWQKPCTIGMGQNTPDYAKVHGIVPEVIGQTARIVADR